MLVTLTYIEPPDNPQPHRRIEKVAIAEEALRRAKASGSLPTEGGLVAVEERINKIRKEAKVARAKRVALAKREVPVAAAVAAERASQVRTYVFVCNAVVTRPRLYGWMGGCSNNAHSRMSRRVINEHRQILVLASIDHHHTIFCTVNIAFKAFIQAGRQAGRHVTGVVRVCFVSCSSGRFS